MLLPFIQKRGENKVHIIKTISFIIAFTVLSSVVVFADTVCLDDPLSCNDILLIATATENATIYNLIGYEYGCNEPQRLIKGAAGLSAIPYL